MKINFTNVFHLRIGKLSKIVMRTFIVLWVTTAFSFVPSNSLSQNAIIKVDTDTVISATEMFELIQEQLGYKFVYNDKIIAEAPKISLVKGKIEANDLLLSALNPIDCTYELTENRTIIVKKNRTFNSSVQQLRVRGTIKDAGGVPLIGASVLEKGTSNGTQSDFDGNFTIDVSGNDAVLVVSYVGFATQELPVAGQSTFNITLKESAAALDEVVVTALGIERSKKSLAYSVTEVGGEEFTEARETNVANALAGKVAGVSVNKTVSGPGGTARVMIRGNTSLTGNNQPLYVVDGIPIDNSNQGSAGMWGGSDGGDGIGNINPDDIESMTVLKGNTAAALYGSRASNGVILITTKSGKLNQGLRVEINSNYVFEEAINLLDPQKEYGHGFNGEKPTTQSIAWDAGESSWGARLDGSDVIQFDGVSRPYSYSGNNFDKFYRTGSTFTNTVSLSGGTADIGYRFGVSNMENESIMPNSGMKRQNFSVNLHGKGLNDKLKFKSSAQYILQDVKNQPGLADSPNNANYSVWQLPVTTNIYDLKGDPNRLGAHPEDATDLYGTQGQKGYELLPSSSIWFQNPYWAAHQQQRGYSKDRVLGSASVQYDINEWVYIKGRAGIDQWDRLSGGIGPTGTGYAPNGSISESQRKHKETNFDIMLGSDHEFDNGIAYNFLAGANKLRIQENTTSVSSNNFALPFFYSVANGISNSGGSDITRLGTHSVYGQAEISYNDWLFLTGSGRNDWFSTLNGRSIFYPSVGLSAILSDVVNMPEVIDFAKFRTAWAQVGGSTDPYALNQFYGLGVAQNGIPQGGISGSTVANSELVPLMVTEFEVGLNMQLFERRLGIDFSYYDKRTEDDILNATISQTSGYTSAKVNVGEVTNKGVELLLTGTPIRTNDFSWDVSFNMSYNKSKVVSLLDPEVDNEVLNIERSRSLNTWVQHIEGLPYGQISGFKYVRDANGDIALDDSGLPIQDTDAGFVPFGTGVHPFVAGLRNSFRYKNLTLSFLIDMKDGAVMHSGTNGQLYRRGVHKNTLVGRENGLGVLPASQIANYYNYIYNNISEEFIYDSGFIKLREITLGFRIPKNVLDDTFIENATLSFVARNLWLIHSSVDNVDPESSYNAGNGQGLEFFGLPQTKSFGFNLNVSF
ncbi:hypothetical protein P278_09810 [Zhouia amylolytica AD3]|uniref:TonB-dependent receptor plug domain-containing protein n=2 Tax=Zhouia amylolytica TaxID=376730 RepID=W2UMU5_9FLAO|nr:hypothetical protein P278_09810 [Zhouia amylolytica AD3]